MIQPWIGVLYPRYMDNLYHLDFEVTETDGSVVKYLVFCHESYQSSPKLQELLSWHDRCGIRTRFVVLESGRTAEYIKSVIVQQYYSQTPAVLRWVLFVGDADQVPMYQMGVGSVWGNYWYSDWYSPGSLTPDQYPEIGVARLSPTSSTTLRASWRESSTIRGNLMLPIPG